MAAGPRPFMERRSRAAGRLLGTLLKLASQQAKTQFCSNSSGLSPGSVVHSSVIGLRPAFLTNGIFPSQPLLLVGLVGEISRGFEEREEDIKMKKAASVFLTLLLGLSLYIPAWGQATRGSLSGSVTDGAGAAIGAATVVVKNIATGEEFKSTSGEQGGFVFPSLNPGTYKLMVEAAGFKRSEISEVIIDVSTPSKVHVTLEVGAVSESVTVTAGSQEVVNTTSPVLSNTINPKQVQDLPLPGRNPVDLARLQAGIAVNGSNTRTATVGGLRGSATNITQDGINAMDNFVKTDSFFALTSPSINSTSEFSVTVGTVGSDAGRGVAQVRLVTPSGTNSLHGSSFWSFRNDALNATPFFNNATGVQKPIERQNFFGFTLSGPVVIPKVYDGRNRSFWFFSYEGFREPFSVTRNRTVLTDQARQGIFRYVGANGQLQTVNLLSLGNFHALNSLTTSEINAMPLPNNSLLGDGFNTAGSSFNVSGSDPNDKIDVRVDQKLFDSSRLGSHKLEFVLHRAHFLTTPDTFNGLESPFPGGVNGTQESTRWLTALAINSTFGGRATNEVRFGHQRAPVGFLRESPPSSPFFIGLSSVSNFENTFLSQGRNTTVYQFIDNFSLIKGTHTMRMGIDTQSITYLNFNDAGTQETIAIGTNTLNANGILNTQFPQLPAGATGTAIANRARAIYNDLVGLLGTASQTFNVTSPTSGFVPGATRDRPIRQRDFSGYWQDSWRMKRNLTLSFGVRWEFEGVPVVLNGLAIQPTNGIEGLLGPSGIQGLFNPGVLKGTGPTSLDFVSGNTDKKLYGNDWNNFAPFIGFAYSPNFEHGPIRWLFGPEGKSSIRGGFSISYLHDGGTIVTNALGTGTTNPGLIQVAANNTPTGVLSSAGVPIAVPTFKIPITDAENFQKNFNNGLWTFDPHLRTPYVQQWSFGIEREIASNTAIELRYVGNHAIKQYRAFNLNEVNIFENGFLNEFMAAQKNLAASGGSSFSPVGAGRAPLPIFSTLFSGLSAATGFANSTFINNLLQNNVGAMASSLAFSSTFAGNRTKLPANFFVANPNAAFANLLANSSFSNYNSFQVEIRRRFSRGLYFQSNYTFSKALTDSEGGQSTLESFRTLRALGIDKHRANFDQTHRFVSNFIYELPFGKGKTFLSNAYAPLRKVIEGWQVGSIITWQSGSPLTIYSNRSTFNSANAGLNPAELVGISFEEFKKNIGIFKTGDGVFFINPALLNIQRDLNTGKATTITLKEGLLGSPAPGTFGNFPRNALTGPNYFQTDISILKRTNIGERTKVELKVNFLNAFNNVNFAVGSFNFDQANFGVIRSTFDARNMVIQLGINF